MKLTVILAVDRAIVLDMCLNSCIVFHFFARFTHNEKDESIKENTYNVLLHPQGGGVQAAGAGVPVFPDVFNKCTFEETRKPHKSLPWLPFVAKMRPMLVSV